MEIKKERNDKSLESYKIFPFIAWALIIGFVMFVYNISLELKDVTADLNNQVMKIDNDT